MNWADILKPEPIYEPVPGAPVQPQARVRVVRDDDRGAPHGIPLGSAGVVVYLEYACGSGQRYPDDPMIGVELDDGRRQEFWRDELAEEGLMDAVCYVVDLGSWVRSAVEFAQPICASNGERVELVRVVLGRLRRLLVERRPRFLVAVVDDIVAPVRRRAWWSDYLSARRVSAEVDEQVERIVELVTLHRIPVLRGHGYEGVDWAATVVAKIRSIGMHAVLVSGDRRLWQLVEPAGEVIVADIGESAVGAQAVHARYGVPPNQLADFWALAGRRDTAPGIPGIGKKTAAKLLAKRGDLDGVLRRWQWEPGKLGPKLRDGAEVARLSRRLLTLATDAPYDFDLFELRAGWGESEAAELRAAAEVLGVEAMQHVRAMPKGELDEELFERWAVAS